MAVVHCPSLNVFGTFFPSWMLCALVGLVGAVLAHRLLAATRLDPFCKPRVLVYPSLTLALTFACWLLWFGN